MRHCRALFRRSVGFWHSPTWVDCTINTSGFSFRQGQELPPAGVPALGMTKSAGVEYAPRGIRINAVCPGTIDTPMVADMLEGQADAMAEIMKEQSIGRLGRAEEVAAAVLWLCSPGASFVIGVGLPVDGGFTAH